MKKYFPFFLVALLLFCSAIAFAANFSSGAPLFSSHYGGQYDDLLDWKVYKNDYYGFEVKYPTQWKFEEQNVPEKVFFLTKPDSQSKESSFLAILPNGGLGYGLPFTTPTEFIKTVGGKKAQVTKWNWEHNAGFLVHFHILEDIKNWTKCDPIPSNCNNLDLHAENDADLAVLLKIVESIKFYN